MEISDIPYNDSFFFLEDDMICFRLSSEGEEACCKVYKIISTLFSDARVIYKFIGFPEDIEAATKFCQNGSIKVFKGRTKFKFFTIAYPELHAEIQDSSNLLSLLRNWSSTIYQTHTLYIVDVDNRDRVRSIIEQELYRDTDSIFSTWPNVKIAIRNQPEAKYHNTFLLFTHKKYLEAIQKLV